MKNIFSFLVISLFSFGAFASQAEGVRSEGGSVISPPLHYPEGMVTSPISVIDSNVPSRDTSAETLRMQGAAYGLLLSETKPHCRIVSKFDATGQTRHGYWLGNDSKKILEDQINDLNKNTGEHHHLECEE